MTKSPVFILSVFDTGILTAKSLYKYKIPLYGFDYNENQIGFNSSFIIPYKCPKPNKSGTELLNYLINKAQNLELKPVLIPASDEYVNFVNENRKELGKYFLFLLPDYDTTKKFINKDLQLQLAKEYGFDLPRFFITKDIKDSEAFKESVNFPCILKPFTSNEKQFFDGKVSIVNDNDSYVNKSNDLLGECSGFIVQEIIEGNSENNYEVNILYLNNEIIFSHVIKKIRQFPDDYGSGCLITTCENEYLENLTRKFVVSNNIIGFSNTEFKYSAKDGKYYFVETNVRVWQQIDITTFMENYVLAYYNYCLGNKVLSENSKPKKSIKWIEVVNDFQMAHKKYSNGEISLREWLKSYDGKKTYGTLSKHDIKPFLREIKYGRKIINYLLKNKNV